MNMFITTPIMSFNPLSRKRVSSKSIAFRHLPNFLLPAFDRHRVHTVIPSHEEIHEAPIVHDSQQHAPISMQDFMQTYGGDSVTSGAVPHDQIGSKVMHPPDCERTVDGPGEKLAKELRLGAAEVCLVSLMNPSGF